MEENDMLFNIYRKQGKRKCSQSEAKTMGKTKK